MHATLYYSQRANEVHSIKKNVNLIKDVLRHFGIQVILMEVPACQIHSKTNGASMTVAVELRKKISHNLAGVITQLVNDGLLLMA